MYYTLSSSVANEKELDPNGGMLEAVSNESDLIVRHLVSVNYKENKSEIRTVFLMVGQVTKRERERKILQTKTEIEHDASGNGNATTTSSNDVLRELSNESRVRKIINEVIRFSLLGCMVIIVQLFQIVHVIWRFLNEPWDADVKGVWLRAVSMAYDTYALSHYTPISSLSLDVFVKLNNPGINEKAEISGISNSANSLNGHLVFGAEEEDRQGRKWSNVAQDEVTDSVLNFDCTSASYDEIDLEVSLDAKHRGCCGISLRCVDEDENNDNEDEDNDNGDDRYACLRQRAGTTDSPRT
ncbi:LOW QUALITY PROTEIN: hypothetical protein V1478_013074, partial [Vespula squamosa]